MTERYDFPVKVTSQVCANGETWEHRVWMGDVCVRSVFSTPLVGDSIAAHALAALRRVMAAA